MIDPGLPMTRAKSGTSLVITEPEPIRAYSPIVIPHSIVALAPILADFFIRVFFRNRIFI